MLALTRKPQQKISLTLPDGTIMWLTVTRIKRNNVTIGIEAPPSVKVLRGELEKQDAMQIRPPARASGHAKEATTATGAAGSDTKPVANAGTVPSVEAVRG